MTNPTLAEFVEAFETIWQKHPDAPRLPDEIIVGYDPPCESEPGSSVFASRCSDGSMAILPDSAAIALCCTTAMRVFRYLEDLGWDGGEVWEIALLPSAEKRGAWYWGVFPPKSSLNKWGLTDSLESACLAALNAIAGSKP